MLFRFLCAQSFISSPTVLWIALGNIREPRPFTLTEISISSSRISSNLQRLQRNTEKKKERREKDRRKRKWKKTHRPITPSHICVCVYRSCCCCSVLNININGGMDEQWRRQRRTAEMTMARPAIGHHFQSHCTAQRTLCVYINSPLKLCSMMWSSSSWSSTVNPLVDVTIYPPAASE